MNKESTMCYVTVSVHEEVSMRGMVDYEIISAEAHGKIVLEMSTEAYEHMRFKSLEGVPGIRSSSTV